MPEPVIALPGEPIGVTGDSIALHEWAHGPSGGAPMHVHHEDDEAWYVLGGTLRFHLADKVIDLRAGGSIFVPRGVAHTFSSPGPSPVRYLIITTPRVVQLIAALHESDRSHAQIYRDFASELLG